VVPGGRFREQYYWDSEFILHGLLESELYDVAESTLQNFMDEVERFGFIPNGGRIYYVDRSQPPLIINMVATYVNRTDDVAILERALPLMEAELSWWETNRTINITSPYCNKTFAMTRYAVRNSALRPESSIEDYEVANGEGKWLRDQHERHKRHAVRGWNQKYQVGVEISAHVDESPFLPNVKLGWNSSRRQGPHRRPHIESLPGDGTKWLEVASSIHQMNELSQVHQSQPSLTHAMIYPASLSTSNEFKHILFNPASLATRHSSGLPTRKNRTLRRAQGIRLECDGRETSKSSSLS